MIKRYSLNQSVAFQNPYRIYVLSSSDTQLLNYETQNIIEQAKFNQSKKFVIQAQDEWQGFLQNNNNYSFFSEPTAYILQLEKNALMSKNFIDFNPNEDEIYIIQTPVYKHAFLEHLQKHPQCVWYSIYPPSQLELWNWLSKKLQSQNFSISKNAQSWFMTQDEIDFHQCQQLYERLILQFSNPQELSLDDIHSHLGFSQQDDWQPLVDAWLLNQKNIIQQKFSKIQLNQDLTLLIWILNRNLQVLLALVHGQQSPQAIFQQYKIWNKHIALFEKAYPYLNVERIHQAICLLHDVDKHVKTYQPELARFKLQRLLLEFPYG